MRNDYYEQYHRNNEDMYPQSRAYDTQYRTAQHQPTYRQNADHAPHHARSTTEPTYTNIYSSSTAYQKKSRKKKKSKLSTGAVAAVLVVCVLLSGIAGFGGSILYSQLNATPSESVSEQREEVNTVNDNSIAKTSVDKTDKSTNEIVEDVADSVVEITTEVVQTDRFYGQYVAQGAGSGVIISEDGFILTNNHVIEGASEITVTLRSGESYEATLVGTDANVDIALLKIEASGLTTAPIGDSSTVNVGEKAVIIGNPLGSLGGSVTEGIVSAVDRSLEINGKTMQLMQTDAAVNPGNSGGGMFNGQGKLIGIVVTKSTDSSSGSTIDNIGFVIPINNALEVLNNISGSTGITFDESSSNALT